ncbi:KH domain-containing protein [Candidatus Saccharibacteria bacterium]|nr:KH domain-containing protein [Candidatus Saccharibacteria bacterium]
MDYPEIEFVELVVRQLVANPDQVKVERILDEKGVLLVLTVDDEDLGKVIGRGGATVNALRSLLRVLGAKNNARYALKVDDPKNSTTQSATNSRPAQAEGLTEQAVEVPSSPEDEVDRELEGLVSDLDL